MSQFAVIGRLQLRAEQFSSETGRAFGELKTRAQTTAQEVRSSFAGAFAETQKLASQALNIPRNTSGGLDLSSEIATLKSAAVEADRHAQALRELSIAQTATAASGRVDAEAMKLEADASAVASLASERAAQAHRDRAAALEIVQNELNQTTAATNAMVVAGDRHVIVSNQQRQSTIMLGQQVQDFAVQVVSGQSVVTAFAQQIGQAGFAVQGMGGKLAGVAAFLGSGWGQAATVALVVLTPLVGKLLEQNRALESASDKLRKEARETEVNRQAKEAFGRTLEGVTAIIRDHNEELKKSIATERSVAEESNKAAKTNLQTVQRGRDALAAQLRDAEKLYEIEKQRARGSGQQSEVAALGLADRAARVVSLRAQLAAADGKVIEGVEQVNRTRAALADLAGQRAADPLKRINDQYDEMKRKAIEAAVATRNVTNALTGQIASIEKRREAALKEERDRQSAADKKGPSLGSQVRDEQGQRILSAAKGFNGAREGSASLRDLFSTAGISVDPEKVAWCAAFVNAVLSGQGIKGTGSLSARSFLGFGTATDKPTQGDIVVLKRGNSTAQGHVGFYAGERNGRVLVTGGNQGDAVSTQGFAKSDVLGFRRAPTAAAEFKTNAREAAQDVRELDAALEAVTKRLDPAAAAAADFTEIFKQIGDLKEAGRITAQRADDLTFKALLAEGEERRERQFAEWKRVLGDAPDFSAGVADYDRDQAAKWGKKTDDLIDRQRDRAEDSLRELSDLYFDLFDSRNGNIWESFERRAVSAIADLAAEQSLGLIFGREKQQGTTGIDGADKAAVTELRKISGGVLKLPKGLSDTIAKDLLPGAGIGALGGGAFAAITGGRNNAIASAAGGAIGKYAGAQLGTALSGVLGAGASSVMGPLGAIAGSIIGNKIAGWLAKEKNGSSTINFGAGGLSAGAATGTSNSAKAQAAASANTVISSISRIADALGGEIIGAGSVSLGYRPGHKAPAYRVDTTGRGRVAGPGVLAFASEEEAIRAAIVDALSDGVVGGISEASKRILTAGGDLEAAITKAAMIESVPRDLKAMLDPVGAAVDDLNRKFKKTVDALEAGGATAEQMAQAQRLYDLQLAQVKNSTASASASLKEFLTSLKVGSSSPLSLRDQEAAAKAALDPYLAQISAGQSIDQSKYQEAARAFLDIERQLYGSTQQFFDAFDAVQASTAKAIATIDNAAPITAAVESPFAKATATAAEKTAANVQTGNEMAEDTNALLGQILAALQAGGALDTASFIGTTRLYGIAS